MKWIERHLKKHLEEARTAEPMAPATESTPVVKFMVRENGMLPTKESDGAAGYDLFVPEDINVPSRRRMIVKLRFCMQLPAGYFADIRPRSGNSSKGMSGYAPESEGVQGRYNCDVLHGVVDSDYRGEVGVILSNHGNGFVLKRGQRIAQMLIQKVEPVKFEAVEHLDGSTRGTKGFGSTGI